VTSFAGFSKDQRRFLVTGAARGVGAEVCKAAKQSGEFVVGVDINAIPEGTVDISIIGDLGDVQFCKTIIEKCGDIDVLVNAAGLLRPQSFVDISPDDFDTAIAVNLRSVFQLCQGVLPSMKDQTYGRIINFSSVVARTGGTTSAVYAAAKAGVLTLTKSIAKEYARFGITANSIAPAAIDTELNNFLTPEGRVKLINDIPVGRFGSAQEFAEVVMFLASDSASFITGATLDVNGGWLMV